MGEFVEVKTAELTSHALDWAVTQARGLEPMKFPFAHNEYSVVATSTDPDTGVFKTETTSYSTEWVTGGPLLTEWAIEFEWVTDATIRAFTMIDSGVGFGPDHLTAACRAIVASKLGDTVQIPKELLP